MLETAQNDFIDMGLIGDISYDLKKMMSAKEKTVNGLTSGIEFLFQQKLSNNFYGVFAYTYFFSEFTGLDQISRPSVWDSRNLISFTGGYKLKRNWAVRARWRFAGKNPYVPTDIEASLDAYPEIILDYDRLGEVKLDAFNLADIRIDKKWNFEKLSFNFFFEIQNFLFLYQWKY